jgi:hypothetical protein
MKKMFLCLIAGFILLAPAISFASDKSDATDLMTTCERNSKITELPVRNFGDPKDIARFEEGLGIVKQGKAKVAQSRFLEAKTKFEEYLKIEKELYQTLAARYIERTGTIIDKIGEDLADYVNQDAVLKYFSSASQYWENAKAEMAKKMYENVIGPCRVAKNYAIGVYTLLKMDIPPEYKKDIADCNKQLYTEEVKTPKPMK